MIDDSNAGTGSFRKDIVDLYPYPIVRAYQRVYRAADPASQHQFVLGLFEIMLKYLAAICISQYEQDRAARPDINNPKLNGVIAALHRPSLGDWQAFVRDISAHYARGNFATLPVLDDLIRFYTMPQGGSVYPAMLAGYNKLRAAYTPAEGGDVARVSFGLLAQKLVTYRNRLAHGAPMTNPALLAARIAWILPALEEALLAARFVAEAGLIYVQDVRFNYYQREFEHILKSYVGATDALPLPPYVTSNVDQSLAPQRLYISRAGAFPQPLLTLHPFLIVSTCERSNELQVFILNQADPRRIEYVCTHCDWIYQPDRIREDFAWLFNDLAQRSGPGVDAEAAEQSDGEPAMPAGAGIAEEHASSTASSMEKPVIDPSEQLQDPATAAALADIEQAAPISTNYAPAPLPAQQGDQPAQAKVVVVRQIPGVSSLYIWLAWSLITGAGYGASLLYFSVVRDQLYDQSLLMAFFTGIIGGLIGAGVAAGQLAVMRRVGIVTLSQVWLLATILSWVAALVVVSYIIGVAFANYYEIPELRNAAVTSMAILGAITAIAQWFALRVFGASALLWIPAVVAGVALAFFLQFDGYYMFLTSLAENTFDLLALFQTLICFLIAGILPSIVLIRLYMIQTKR